MKVTINNAIPKTSSKGKSYQTVVFNGNQEASAWDDDFTPHIGKDVEVEITANGKFSNVKLVKSDSSPAQKPAATTGRTYQTPDIEYRRSAMALALEMMSKTGQTITDDSITAKSAWIEGLLRNGFVPGQKPA